MKSLKGMAERKRDIDSLFRKELAGHEKKPPSGLWSDIDIRLARRKRAGLLYRVAGIAAAILILLGLGGGILQMFRLDKVDNYLSTSSDTLTKPLPEIEKMPAPRQPPSHTAPEPFIAKAGDTSDTPEVFKPVSKQVPEPDAVQRPVAAPLPEAPGKRTPGELSSAIASNGRLVLPESQVAQGIPFEGTISDTGKRLFAGLSVAPNYSYRTLSNVGDGALSKEHFENKESGLASISLRLSAGYHINSRFSIITGIDLLGMGQSIGGLMVIKDLSVIENLAQSYPRELKRTRHPVTNSLGEIRSEGPPLMISDEYLLLTGDMAGAVPLRMYASTHDDPARLIQGVYYLQVPLMARYYVANGATRIYLNGGIGASFLTGNRVTLRYRGESFGIGQTLNINNFGLTGILGAGFERELFDNFSLNIEPRITHFLTPANSSSFYISRPYSISISGGIYYGF